jgi:hypothetical protein
MEAQVYGQFMNQRKLQNNSEELNEGKEGFREQVGRRGKRTGRCIEIGPTRNVQPAQPAA